MPYTRIVTTRMRHSGWTLLEMIVVLAILSALMAVMMPVLQNARSKAKQTGCVSNLRQLAQAMRLYASDWDGLWPCTGDRYLWTGRRWRPVLQPYVRERNAFWCPADHLSQRQYDSTSYAYAQCFYHTDASIASGDADALHTCVHAPEPRGEWEVVNPGGKVLLAEWFSAHELPLRTLWAPDGSHTMVFADGHARPVRLEQLNRSVRGDRDPGWTHNGLSGIDLP